MGNFAAKLLAACVLVICTAPPGSCKLTNALILSQWDEIEGEHEIVLTSTALRMFSKKSQTTLIARAPDWKIYFFNTNKKVMMESEPKRWHCPFGLVMGVVANGRFKNVPPKLLGTATVAGVTANHLQVFILAEHTSNGKLVRVEERPADYYVSTTNLHLPQPICVILQRSFGMPPAEGIPLCLSAKDSWGKILKTNECRHARVDLKLFEIPKDFRRVTTDSAVVFSDKQDLIDDFVNGQ